jgi:hypothetical protein
MEVGMRVVDSRTLVGFTVGAGVAVACTVAGASFGQQPTARVVEPPAKALAAATAAPPVITAACADKKTGTVTVIGKKHKKCTKAEKAIRFATPAAPATSILGSDGSLRLKGEVQMTSPNGLYVLVLTDSGLGLKGPGGTMTIDPFSVATAQSRKTP